MLRCFCTLMGGQLYKDNSTDSDLLAHLLVDTSFRVIGTGTLAPLTDDYLQQQKSVLFSNKKRFTSVAEKKVDCGIDKNAKNNTSHTSQQVLTPLLWSCSKHAFQTCSMRKNGHVNSSHYCFCPFYLEQIESSTVSFHRPFILSRDVLKLCGKHFRSCLSKLDQKCSA